MDEIIPGYGEHLTQAAENLEAVVAAGRRARTTAKKATWSELGAAETTALERLIRDASDGRVDEASLERWVE